MPPSVRPAEPQSRRLASAPWLVTSFLVAILSIQAVAFARQFQRGFVPLHAAPGRVPFSWDMFAVPIERCGIEWTPGLVFGEGKAYPTLRSMAPTLEWDPVYDTVADYLEAARFGCGLTTVRTHVRLTCMTRHGVSDYAFDCP
jgi:hypothetical protein